MTIKNILQGMRDTVAAYTPNAIKNGAAWAGRNIQVCYSALSARVNSLFSYTVSTPVASIPVGKIGFYVGAIAIVAVAARVFQKELTEDEKLAAELKQAQAKQKDAQAAYDAADKNKDRKSANKKVGEAADKKLDEAKKALDAANAAVKAVEQKIADKAAKDKAAQEAAAKEAQALKEEQAKNAAELKQLQDNLDKAQAALAQARGEATSADLDKSSAATKSLPQLEESVNAFKSKRDELIEKAKKAKEATATQIKQNAVEAQKKLEELKAEAKKKQEEIAAAEKAAKEAAAKAAALQPKKGWFSFGKE